MSFLYSSVLSIVKKMPRHYYAVANGRNPGIYDTWDECKEQVHHYSSAAYKKFDSQAEAYDYINRHSEAREQSNSSGNDYTSYSDRYSASEYYALGRRATVQNEAPRQSSYQRRHASTYCDDDDDEPSSSSKQRKTALYQDTRRDHKANSGGFNVDKDGYTNVYTDGACSSNGGKNARAGIGIWFGDNNPLNVSRAVDGRATNNMAEIQAVTIAARKAKEAGITKLKINTDSEFLIKCKTEWMPNWKRNGWKTSANKPVINKEELIEMEKALAPLDVTFNHVRGHAGIEGNEKADKLARAGCSEY